MLLSPGVSLARRLTFTAMSDDEEAAPASSPAHTRSGRVYVGNPGNRRRRRRGSGRRPKEAEGGEADGEEEQDDRPSLVRPRLLSYRTAEEPTELRSSPSRTHSSLLHSPTHHTSPFRPSSSPVAPRLYLTSPASPACRVPTMSRLNLLDSPRHSVTPHSARLKSRLLSASLTARPRPSITLRISPEGAGREIANVNPFTPVARGVAPGANYSSQSEELSPGDSPTCAGDTLGRPPAKRVRVSDMNVTRFQDEFLTLATVASGQFGDVLRARHRLDGVIYAVKVTKKALKPNSRDEKVALNEVFAHAAIMKHRHVVRYFNSWVEAGHIYIQNEFCEGGSLERRVERCREVGERFAEAELRKVLVQVGRGLQYLHGKRLVHLDIKPGNILIAFGEEDALTPPSPRPLSPDSGAASGDCAPAPEPLYGPTPDTVRYKIGDLGHVVSFAEGGELGAEEGDCRYMAPEFLGMVPVAGPLLPRADMFSTGLAVYEAARLLRLPRNSAEGADYPELRAGRLPALPHYSVELQELLRALVHPEPAHRPSADRLLASKILNPSAFKSKVQLLRELNQEKKKVEELQLQQRGGTRLVRRGVCRSASIM